MSDHANKSKDSASRMLNAAYMVCHKLRLLRQSAKAQGMVQPNHVAVQGGGGGGGCWKL
jgi:hypothetical protein